MTQVIVTDHALIRWLERSRGIDMAFLRSQLAEIAQPYADLKIKHVCVDGSWLVFQDNRLVTVAPNRPEPASVVKHDLETVNGTHVRGEKAHWKWRKRRNGK